MKRIAIVAGTMFSVVACLGQQRQPNIVFYLGGRHGVSFICLCQRRIRLFCLLPSSGASRVWVSMATLS